MSHQWAGRKMLGAYREGREVGTWMARGAAGVADQNVTLLECATTFQLQDATYFPDHDVPASEVSLPREPCYA